MFLNDINTYDKYLECVDTFSSRLLYLAEPHEDTMKKKNMYKHRHTQTHPAVDSLVRCHESQGPN